ncbi:MAG: selenide, water dikinase SelD [Peptococcaceae bacterium]
MRQLQLSPLKDRNLLVGLETSDDAAVYKLTEDLALIQTVDFFTPVVDDPYFFGQVAATNALSDIYAMGGRPLLALNIVCFPNCLPLEWLTAILQGGADKVAEAGAIIAGGHSVQDDEPKYGLAVTGLVSPQKVITNAGALPGDVLILTKPVGTGIITTGIKAGLVSPETQAAAVTSMTTINAAAAMAMHAADVHACTDITGFGLLGHAAEMALASNVSLELEINKIPLLPEIENLASLGLIPGGAYKNRDYLINKIVFAGRITATEKMFLFDPQTSGGLFIALPGGKERDFFVALNRQKKGVLFAQTVGRVTEKQDHLILVK